MKIQFKSLTVEHFKNHSELQISFGDITSIGGRNGVGKSSVGEAVTWVLYNTDPFGTKIDPKPIGNEDAETKVELLLSVDGKDILLGRSQKKTATYYINEVPTKAKEYEAFVAELFDKNLFLSLFNPNYFSSQHWQDQRAQLLQYVKEPLNKEVFAEMAEVIVKEVEPELKKRSLDDLEKIHKDRKNKHDKSIERASERVLTLKEQFEKQYGNGVTNVEDTQKQVAELQAERNKIEQAMRAVQEQQQQYNQVQYKIQGVKQEIEKQKKIVLAIRGEQPIDTCRTCGQALPEEAMEKVKQDRVNRFNHEKQIGSTMVAKLDELEATFSQMAAPETPSFDRLNEIDSKLAELNITLRRLQQVESLKQEIEEAQQEADRIRKERNESIFILDGIKDFRTKRSELMVKKIQSLFTTISVNLYETLKNGEERATFEVVMDGKSYVRLSTAEKIKAGLEMVEVLSQQSDLVAPIFIDNAESILHFQKPSGQLIIAKVEDTEFTVQAKTLEIKEEIVNG